MRSIARAVRAGSLLIAAVGCGSDSKMPGQACTAIGCVNGLSMPFSRALRDPGAYSLRIELDGTVVTCQASLPFASCEAGGGCSSPGVQLGQSGCALPPEQHELIGLQIPSTPARVKVEIERDGVPVAAGDVSPSYTQSQPNGEGCGPVCVQATATLIVP